MPSVVIPCFNAAATLPATLASALAAPEVREVIAVDDGSTDATADVLAACAAREPRVRVVRQANAGAAAARNAGVLAARSAIIALLDGDDLWHPGHLAANLAHLARRPDVGVSFSRARFVDAAGRPAGVVRPRLDGIEAGHILSGNPATTCSTMVVRRAVFEEAGGFDVMLARAEDQEWLFRVAATTRWRIAGIDAVLVDYRTSGTGLASDIEAFAAAFDRVVEAARRSAPGVVAASEAGARARMHRWLARRALRLGLERGLARRHVLRAIAHAPAMLWQEPRASLGTLAAALLPRHPLLDRLLA